MKKTTLNKLVKLALYEVYKEKNKEIPKGLKLEKLSHSEQIQLNENLMRRDEKKRRLLREQKQEENLEKIYNFLIKNSSEGVPLEKIADDPLLKDINIDGLGAIYKVIGTINLEEFLELSHEFFNPPTNTCNCAPNCPDYGTFQIFESVCNDGGPHIIDDRFICCSSNNEYSDDMQYTLQLAGSMGDYYDIGGTGDNVCFGQQYVTQNDPNTTPPPLFLGNTGGPAGVGQISYDDLNNFLINYLGDLNGLIGDDPQWNTSYYNGTTTGTNPQPGGSCVDCPHPLAFNYVAGTLGCLNGQTADPNSYECCEFYGCGGQTAPVPTNIDEIQPTGNFPLITGNEDQPYWVEDGSCQFIGCTLGSVNINVPADHPNVANNPVNFPTTTPGASSTVTSTGTNQYYGIGVTNVTPDDSCVVEVCANPVLNINTATPGTQHFIALQSVLNNTFVAPVYQNPTGTAGGYSVVNANGQCTVTACNDPLAFNYFDFGNAGVGVNGDDDLCIDVEEGCTDDTMFNYNPNATTDDGSCIAFAYGCTDGTMLNYDPAANTDDGSCIAYVYGCTNPVMFNYNPSANTDDGSCIAELIGCLDGGGGIAYGYTDGAANTVYAGTGQANNYNFAANTECTAANSTCVTYDTFTPGGPIQQTTNSGGANYNPDGCCCVYSPGCTILGSANYNASANQDDGNCIGGVPGCTSPGMDTYDPAANIDDGSCEYNGCVDDGDYTGIIGQTTPSPWLDYVCLNDTAQVTDSNGVTKYIGEWLCDCIMGSTCTASSQFNNTYGAYIDGTTFLQAQNNSSPTTTTYTDPNVGGAQINGSCAMLETIEGCSIQYYTQNNGLGNIDPNVTPSTYSSGLNTHEVGSCNFYGCDDPGAINYFCIDNASATQTLNGVNTTVDLCSGGTLDPLYGTSLGSPAYDCEYPESFNCLSGNEFNLGCQDPGDGLGTFTTLAACEGDCTTISYNCEPSGCVEDTTGQPQYTIATAEASCCNASDQSCCINYPNPYTGAYDVGDPLQQCNTECTAVEYDCDPDFGCYPVFTGNGQFSTLSLCEGECISFDCNPDLGCWDPGGGNGTYIADGTGNVSQTILEMCEAECHECSMVSAQKCLGTNQRSFDCLEIDGEMGDPGMPGNMNQSYPVTSPYGNGQFFETGEDVVGDDDMIAEQRIVSSTSEVYEVTNIINIWSIDPITSVNSSECYEGFNCDRMTPGESLPTNQGSCTGTGTQNGDFTGPTAGQDCLNTCKIETFNCNSSFSAAGGCTDPLDGTGVFNYATSTANGFGGDPSAECSGTVDVPWDPYNPSVVNGYNTPGGEYNCPGGVCGNCFTGDTLITMPDNTTKRIDELKVDEIVKSEKETSQIIKIDVHKGEFDLYSINGSKHFVTEDHPFQTTDGWKAITPNKARKKHQIEAFTLKVGEVLIKENGEQEEIISLEKSEEKITTTTYNLRLDNEHVYYANNYLVHNGGVTRAIPLNEKVAGYTGECPPWLDPIGKDAGGDWPFDPTGGGPVSHKCIQAHNQYTPPTGCGNNLTCCIPATSATPSNASVSGVYPSLNTCLGQCEWVDPNPLPPPSGDTDSKEITESKKLRKQIEKWRKNNL